MAHDKHRRAEAPATPKAAAEAVKVPKAAKDRATPASVDAKEDPEDYSDPICVCEPEPYWQEIAERLEQESRAPK
jgi:hypothetical protein